MATIANIVRDGKGKAHAWRIEREKTNYGTVCSLFHYSTKMLTWLQESPTNSLWHDYNIGHGSVSDQNGMNTAFRVLNMPYRYHRDYRGGGPRIERY